jgi:hypothetical protein
MRRRRTELEDAVVVEERPVLLLVAVVPAHEPVDLCVLVARPVHTPPDDLGRGERNNGRADHVGHPGRVPEEVGPREVGNRRPLGVDVELGKAGEVPLAGQRGRVVSFPRRTACTRVASQSRVQFTSPVESSIRSTDRFGVPGAGGSGSRRSSPSTVPSGTKSCSSRSSKVEGGLNESLSFLRARGPGKEVNRMALRLDE